MLAPLEDVQAKSNLHSISLTTDAVALFVWLSAGTVLGHFSDNGFLMAEESADVNFTSDIPVTTDQLRFNLSVTCLNCLGPTYAVMSNIK